jgi:AsmA-like C-terminal region/Protein of unknown function
MNDKIITRVIPKIHLRIGLFLLFVFLVGFFTFIALLEGFGVDRLKLGDIKIEKLYLKWDNALLIKASKVDLSDLKKDNIPLTLKPLSKLPSTIRWVEEWVESVQIDTIQYKEYKGSLQYQKHLPGEVVLNYGGVAYKGSFALDERSFHLTLPKMSLLDGNISGTLSVKLKEQKLAAYILLSLPNTPDIQIIASGNTDTLSVTAHADREFTTIKPLVRFFHVDSEVEPWIVDYAKASSLTLHRFDGSFHYDKPEELLDGLHADATISTAEYTFASGFEPIKAPSITLKFLKGKLYITPNNGTFYTLPTERSSLFIDFTTPHTMLNIFIQTRHAKLNDPLLALLRYYDINLPVKQMTGECTVDLNLSVNLHNMTTTAQGIFRPGTSELLLDQIPLRSQGGIVRLDNTRVSFEEFIAHYGDNIAHARVKGEYDAHSEHGIVSIDAYDVSPTGERQHLTLFDSHDPLRISYVIAPDHDTLSVNASKWNLLGETLKIDAFQTIFDYHRAYAAVQAVPFAISNKVHGQINAVFNGLEKKTDVRVRLADFHIGEIALRNAPMDINIHYENALSTLQIPHGSSWSIHQLPLLVSSFSASLKDDKVTFDRTETVLGDFLKGNFTGEYHLDTKKGAIRLSNMIPLSPNMVPLVEPKESINFSLNASGDEINLDSEALKTHFSTIPQGWKVSLDDISLLSRRSPLLRRYDIDNGTMNLFYTGESSRYTFNGEINYPYALMVINDEPTSRYRFSGAYQDGQSSIRINDRLILTHTPEAITLRANNAGINMPQLAKFLSGHPQEKDTRIDASAASLPIRIYATHTYLYLMKGREIVADTLNATLNDNDLDASLHYMQGSATLKMRNGLFYIDGHEFNDKFMEHLFMFSDFSGGKFSFQAKGDSESFEGIMRIENTILKEYKVLNNVLAFVNTVPSLATFSLPNYNTQGLPVKEGYAHFAYDKGIINVDNLTLNSPEIKIFGEGHANIKNETLFATLTLKTDLGSKLSKVPVVGYILLGDDGSLSTTLTVTGKLDNPIVETAFAKEIVTAPFNILKRTLIYPFLWMLNDDKKK